jgi:hypothetical protein
MARPDPNASDWSDLDLLTADEAGERLVAEIAAVTEELRGLPAGPEHDALQQRLVLLERARQRHGREGS